MGLFKRFTENRQASKEELEGFKMRLKYGDDPSMHYKKSREYYKKYREHHERTEELLRTMLKPKEVSKRDNWSKMEINMWTHHGKCEDSPIGEHVVLHHFGEDNPKRGVFECLCCGQEI
jgi:hypothetical protein